MKTTTASLSAELVRGFAAVDDLLQQHYQSSFWRTPDVVAEELRRLVAACLDSLPAHDASALAHALGPVVDALGRRGELDPWDVLAFRAPVSYRSHQVVLSDPSPLPENVAAVEARLLAEGITVADYLDGSPPSLEVSAPSRAVADAVVGPLLPGVQIDWIGEAPREIRPARCTSWRRKAPDELRVWVRMAGDRHIEEVVAAEDDERIVVMAFTCRPVTGPFERPHEEPAKVYTKAPIGSRRVICGVTGERIPEER